MTDSSGQKEKKHINAQTAFVYLTAGVNLYGKKAVYLILPIKKSDIWLRNSTLATR
jgi:hypothetical protein